jgi:hypothetical protein
MGERAIALLGPSGSGKTSLALALCRMGASFLADDVVAVERVEGLLIAHPGTPLAGVAHAEAERLPASLTSAGVLAVNGRERLLRVSGHGESAPLSTLMFLALSPHGPEKPTFQPISDARSLLSATFNLALEDPGRLSGLLEVCAIAARGRVERVLAGPSVDSTELAAAVMQRLEQVS